MTRPTIASLQDEIAFLRSDTAALVKDRDETNMQLIRTRERNQQLTRIANEERKESAFLIRRMNEINERIREIRSRLSFAMDCVGGRPGGECVPMGAKLHVDVAAILARAVDVPASNALCESDTKNMKAHGHLRKELPDLDALDMDAT